MPTRPIVLMTDFGSRDPFVGVMKCVIEAIAPGTTVIDLLHEIAPQDVRGGAVALSSAVPFLPPHAVVVAVVDPGVGTSRRMIAAETDRAVFLAPDNGLLTLALRDLPPSRVHALARREHFLSHVSATFHGRDVFAPAAARVASGLAITKLGPRVRNLVELPFATPSKLEEACRGEVIAIDRYGNARTNIPGSWVHQGDVVRIARKNVCAVVAAYGDVPAGRVLALVGSGRTLEIAVHLGNAAENLRLEVGSTVEVRHVDARR